MTWRPLTTDDLYWRLQGSCSELDGDDFFPNPSNKQAVSDARVICHSCPVQKRCLKESLWEPWGIWAGTTPSQRKTMRWKAGAA
jgi:WhiB family transcriptional regulator, redox-sensing transcriptional regulator